MALPPAWMRPARAGAGAGMDAASKGCRAGRLALAAAWAEAAGLAAGLDLIGIGGGNGGV